MQENRKKITAFLLDWDNTLVDTWRLIEMAMNETLLHFDRPRWSIQDIKTNAQQAARVTFPTLFAEQSDAALHLYRSHYQKLRGQYLRPLPGADIFLAECLRRGLPCALVSNKSSELLREEVTLLGWDIFFSAIVGSGDALKDKPAPDPAFKALESLGLVPSFDVWLVGDASTDMECAQASGCSAVGFGDDVDGLTMCQINVKDMDELYRLVFH